jgi:flavin reductase (DIM6/NTAB) family NADH-FMN oxidoreductase RutF
MVSSINALARTTGSEDVPAIKIALGYRFEKDKFKIANLTPDQSSIVTPPRIRECPVQMEAVLIGTHELMKDETPEV